MKALITKNGVLWGEVLALLPLLREIGAGKQS